MHVDAYLSRLRPTTTFFAVYLTFISLCPRFDACHGHDEQLHHQTKKFWNTLNAKKKGGEKSEGVDNKG